MKNEKKKYRSTKHFGPIDNMCINLNFYMITKMLHISICFQHWVYNCIARWLISTLSLWGKTTFKWTTYKWKMVIINQCLIWCCLYTLHVLLHKSLIFSQFNAPSSMHGIAEYFPICYLSEKLYCLNMAVIVTLYIYNHSSMHAEMKAQRRTIANNESKHW